MTESRLPRASGASSDDASALGSERTIAHYEFELAGHIREEARLRGALARVEALLLARESFGATISHEALGQQPDNAGSIANLTPRQHEIMYLVLAGQPSKNIAADLGISRRTVENHRAAIMKKTGSKSLPALGRFGFVASQPAHTAA